MAGPWEKFTSSDTAATAEPSTAPWTKFGPGNAQVETPTPADDFETKAAALADYLEATPIGQEAPDDQLFGNAFVLGLKDKVAGLSAGVGGAIRGKLGNDVPVDGFLEGFSVGRRAQEILEERARERSGGMGKVAEVTGSLASGVLARAPIAASWMGKILQGVREAGTLATIQGIGDSEGETVAEVAGDAVKSGASGAAIGGALTGTVEGLRGLAKAGRSVIRAAGSAMDDETGKATRKVFRALQDDGVTPSQAAARMSRRDTALINVADENTLGLARAASAKPGEGRTTLNRALDLQQKSSPEKVMAAVGDALGGADKSFNRRVADMVRTRANLGKTQYGNAFRANFNKAAQGAEATLEGLLPRIPQEALTNAQRIAKAEGRPFGQQLVASIDDAGTVAFSRAPSLEEWHYVQRGLRSAADNAYRSGVGEVGSAYKALHKEVLGAMDASSPLYAKARKAYAGQSDLIDAIQRGREVLAPSTTKNVDALVDEIADLSKGERDMMKIGLARQIEDMIGATPDRAGDMVKKIFGTGSKRDAIRAVFDSDKAFRNFETKMANIAKEAKSFQFVRTGSRTAFVDAEKKDAGILADAASGVVDMSTGGVGSTALRGAAKILRDLGGMDEGVAREVAKILVERDPDVVRNALSTATNRANNQAARTLLLSRARPFVRALTVGASKDAGAKVGAN